jgi:hypothetical protein
MSLTEKISQIMFVPKPPKEIEPWIPKSDLLTFGQGHDNTPDWYALETKRSCLLFVADEMMRGYAAHRLLPQEMVQRYGYAYTIGKFSMFKKMLGKRTYPVIFPEVEGMVGRIARAELAPIMGELYIVKPSLIKELDKYKENGRVHHRIRVQLDIPYRQVVESYREASETNTSSKTSAGETAETASKVDFFEPYRVILGDWQHWRGTAAWIYVADPEYFHWSNYADEDTFKAVRLRIPADRNKQPFYHFRIKE